MSQEPQKTMGGTSPKVSVWVVLIGLAALAGMILLGCCGGGVLLLSRELAQYAPGTAWHESGSETEAQPSAFEPPALPQTTSPALSADALELLVAAAESKRGWIVKIHEPIGTKMLVGSRNFYLPPGGPRARAKWNAALDELAQRGLVEAESSLHQGSMQFDYWHVTDAGYKLADVAEPK